MAEQFRTPGLEDALYMANKQAEANNTESIEAGREAYGTKRISSALPMFKTLTTIPYKKWETNKVLDPSTKKIFYLFANNIVNPMLESLVPNFWDTTYKRDVIQDARTFDMKINYTQNMNFGVKVDMNDQKRMLENIIRTGRYMEFDTEGLDTAITEFSIVGFSGADFKNGTHEGIKVHTDSASRAFIGLYGDDLQRAYSIARSARYNSFGAKEGAAPKNLEYVLDVLQKAGSDKTSFEIDKATGLYRLTSYAGDADVANRNWDDIDKGLEVMRQIGEYTHNLKQVDFTVNLPNAVGQMAAGPQTFHVRSDEAEIFRSFFHAQGYDIDLTHDSEGHITGYSLGNRSDDNTFTIAGRNTVGYDINRMQHKLATGTDGAQSLLRIMTQGSGDITRGLDFFDETIVMRGSRGDQLTKDQAYKIAARGTTRNKSEGIATRYSPVDIEEASAKAMGSAYIQHAAYSDTVGQGFSFFYHIQNAITPSEKEPNKSVNKIFDGIEAQRTANFGDVFYARTGMFSKTATSGFSGVVDGLTGEYRFVGGKAYEKLNDKGKNLWNVTKSGITVSADGMEKDVAPSIMNTFGLKKNTLSMYLGTQEFNLDNMDDAARKAFLDQLGDAANEKLSSIGTGNFYISFFTKYGTDNKNRDVQFFVGTLRETQEFFGKQIYAGSAITKKDLVQQEIDKAIGLAWNDWQQQGKIPPLISQDVIESAIQKANAAPETVEGIINNKILEVWNYIRRHNPGMKDTIFKGKTFRKGVEIGKGMNRADMEDWQKTLLSLKIENPNEHLYIDQDKVKDAVFDFLDDFSNGDFSLMQLEGLPNINQATREELLKIKGIGPKTADKISQAIAAGEKIDAAKLRQIVGTDKRAKAIMSRFQTEDGASIGTRTEQILSAIDRYTERTGVEFSEAETVSLHNALSSIFVPNRKTFLEHFGFDDIKFNPDGSIDESSISENAKKYIAQTDAIAKGQLYGKDLINEIASGKHDIKDVHYKMNPDGTVQRDKNGRPVIDESKSVSTQSKKAMGAFENPRDFDTRKLVTESIEHEEHSSLSDWIRGRNYNQTKRIMASMDVLDDITRNFFGIDNGYASNIRYASEHVLDALSPSAIAKLPDKQRASAKKTYGKLEHALGYTYNKKFHKPMSNTVVNTLRAIPYFEARKTIINAALAETEKNVEKNASSSYRDSYFQSVLHNMMDAVHNELDDPLDDNSPAKFSTRKIDKGILSFNIAPLSKNRVSTKRPETDNFAQILSIDLNEDSPHWVNQIKNKTGIKSDIEAVRAFASFLKAENPYNEQSKKYGRYRKALNDIIEGPASPEFAMQQINNLLSEVMGDRFKKYLTKDEGEELGKKKEEWKKKKGAKARKQVVEEKKKFYENKPFLVQQRNFGIVPNDPTDQYIDPEYVPGALERFNKLDKEKQKEILTRGADLIGKYEMIGSKTTDETIEGIATDLTDISKKRIASAVNKDDLERFGYNSKQAQRIVDDFNTRLTDTQAYIETLLKPILSDKRIGYSFDKEHGSLTLIDTTTGYQRDISNLLPRENYDPITGTFSTMFGGRKLATAKNFQEVTTYKKDGTATTYYDIVSNIKRLQLAIQPLMRGTNNSRRSLQDRIDYLSWAVRTGLDKIADKNINRFDVEDNRLSRSTSLLEFFQHLPYLYYNGAYDGRELNKETRELLESDSIRNRYNKALETYEATHVNAEGKHTTEGFSFQIDDIKTSEMATFLSDFNNLIAPMKEKDSRLSELLFQRKDDVRKRVYETLNEGTFKGGKHPEGAYESDTNFTKNIFGIFGPDNRHVESVANRSTYIQYDEYDDEFRKILGVDSVVSTKYRDNRIMERWYRAKYAGDTKIDTLRVEKVTIDTNLAHRIAAARIKSGTPITGNGYEIKNTSVLFAYLNESGSIADPRLLDGLSRNIVQKESTKDLMDLAEINRLLGRDAAARQEKIRNNTEQLIKFVTNQDGSLRYEYQEKENEKILLKRGDTIDYNLTYANTKQELTADRTGFLTRRYYDAQGRIVSQDDITSIINHDESLREILLRENLKSNNANGTIEVSPSLKNAIDDVLESHGIRSRYAVEAIDTQTYKKMLDVSEKSVMQFPIAGLGEFDTRIRNLVNYARGTQPNSNEPYIAPNLSTDVIRDKEKLEVYLGSLSNDRTSPFVLDEALKKAGFKDIYDNNGELVKTGFRDFVDTATKERSAYFEAYKGILEDYTGMDLSKTAVISATLAEWTKGSHQEVSRLQSGINDAIHFRAEQILKQNNNGRVRFSDALTEASLEFSALLKKNNIFLDKNGNNIASSGLNASDQTVIDQDALYTVNQKKLAQLITDFTGTPADRFFTLTKDAAKQLGMEGKELDNYADKVVISRGTAELSAVSDADEVGLNNGHNQKGFKITRRVMQNIEQDIVDTQSAQRLVVSYQGLIDNGHDSASIAKLFNKKFADMGLSVTANGDKLELNPLKNTPPITNQGIINNLRQEVFRGGRGLIELESDDAINDFIKNNQRDVAHLEAVGMSEDAIRSTLEGFKAAKVDAVSIDKMVSTYAYSTQNTAYQFNKAMSEAKTPEEQEKLLQDFFKDNKNFGASAHSIFDLHMDSKQFIDNDELNPMVRAGVIDLGPNVEKGKPRYIAYGFNNQPIMGNDDHNGVYTGDKVRDELYSLRAELDKNNEVEARLQRPVSDILSERAENIIQAVSDVRGAKNGTIDQMTSSYLVGSGMFKADIVRVRGASLENSILKEAKVDGLSLAEHAAAGHRINATFVSREAIENMMDAGGELDAALSAIGINKESFQKEKNIAISNLNASGGAVGIQGRHPSEYANSFSGSHIFLDDTLKGAEARVTDMSLAAENGDKDGDLVYAAMARADVEINGKKFRLNQLQIQTLKSAMQNNNLNFDVKYDEKQFNAFAASADYVGSASFSGVVDNALTSLNDEDIRQMTLRANTTTNVDVGGLLINTGGLTHEEQAEKINYAKQNIMTASNEDYVHAIEQYRGQKISNRADYSDEDWQKYSQDLVDSVTTEELGAGKVAIGKTSDIGSHESIANTYLTNKYGTNGKLDWDAMSDSQHQAAFTETEALAAHLNQEALNSEIIRTIMRKDAGLINMNTYRFRSVMQSLIDNGETNGLSSGDEHIIQQMIAHINEAGQAPKNATAISSGLENLDSALKDFFGVNRRSIRKKEAFYDILDQMIESNVKEYKNLPLYADIPEVMRNTKSSDEDVLNAIKQRTHEAFDNLLADDRAINERVYTNLRMGYAQSGIAETIMTQNKNDMLHAYDIINNHINETTGWKEAMKDDGQPLTLAAGRDGQIKEMDGITDSADDFKEPTHFVDDKGEGMALADQIRGSIKSLKSMAHGHGAMAMLGFAGLTMMSGMIGGAPTAPQPSDQAQGISQENAMYEIPSTMAGQGTASGANQSYIININASTDQGRDFGENAIRQAFANMPQTSKGGVNMTMNIKDSSSNIDFRDVANYISTNL